MATYDLTHSQLMLFAAWCRIEKRLASGSPVRIRSRRVYTFRSGFDSFSMNWCFKVYWHWYLGERR